MTPPTGLIHRLRAATGRGNDRESTDAELLNAYIAAGDGLAFEAIVRRHGRMVLSLCRRLLRNHADADDAFQATFLVLVRKAASIRPRNMLPGWLYGVAYKASLKVRTSTARRQAKERETQAMPRIGREGGPVEADVLDALDRELARLPDDLRSAVVLCELEGKTRKEAARELGWPEGTVASRLAHGRGVLAQRLAPFNVCLGAGSLAALSPAVCPAIVPASLYVSVAEAASAFAAGFSTAAPALAVAIAEGVIKSMFLSKLKTAAVALAVCTALGLTGPSFVATPSAAAPATPVTKSGTASGAEKPGKKQPNFNHHLLRNEAVLKDLELTDAEKEKITSAFKEAEAAMQRQFQNVQIAIPAGGAGGAVIAAPLIRIDTWQMQKDLIASLVAVLKPEHLIRLRSIDLQARGAGAFTDRKVVRALQLTEVQEDKIEDIVTQFDPSNRVFGGLLPGADAPKQLAEAQDKDTAACVKLLTKDQLATWKKLIGKPLATSDLLTQPVGGGAFFGNITTVAPAIALPPIAPPAK